MIKALLRRTVGSTHVYRVYKGIEGQSVGAPTTGVQVYDAAVPPPPNVLKSYGALGWLGLWSAKRLLRRHGGVMLAILLDETLAAYGWIQTWKGPKRLFWWLADDAICLGPYWTHPDYRGQGLYPRLLAASLAECAVRFPGKDIFIWCGDRNFPSARGIEKAGFRSLGRHAIVTRWCGLVRRHRTIGGETDDQQRSTPGYPAG